MPAASPPPTLLIQADDFGASSGINRAVIAAYAAGKVQAASLMANAARAEEAAALARAHPGLQVGLHINLTAQAGQRCLARPADVPLLARADGRLKHGFLGLFLLSAFRAGELRRQAETEMRAQLDWVLSRGIRVSHIDSHRHVHMIPPLFRTARKLQAAYGIGRLRRVNESLWHTHATAGLGSAWLNGGLVKWAVLRLCGWAAGAGKWQAGVDSGPPAYFYSILHSTRMHGRVLRRFKPPARHETVELCFHPALMDEDGDTAPPDRKAFLLDSPHRRREFDAIMERH